MELSLDLRIQQLRSKLTIFQVLERLGVELSRGASTQQIPCPFHDDRRPSARLYSDTNRLYCFTCARTWDQISSVVSRRDLSYPEAVRWLEEQFQISYSVDDLTSVMRAKLTPPSKPPVNLVALFQEVEKRLIDARHALGLERYCKLLVALDIIAVSVHNKSMSPDTAVTNMKQILAKVSPTNLASASVGNDQQ